MTQSQIDSVVKYHKMIGKEVVAVAACTLIVGSRDPLFGLLTLSGKDGMRPAISLLQPSDQGTVAKTLWIVAISSRSFTLFQKGPQEIYFTNTTAPFESCRILFSDQLECAKMMNALGKFIGPNVVNDVIRPPQHRPPTTAPQVGNAGPAHKTDVPRKASLNWLKKYETPPTPTAPPLPPQRSVSLTKRAVSKEDISNPQLVYTTRYDRIDDLSVPLDPSDITMDMIFTSPTIVHREKATPTGQPVRSHSLNTGLRPTNQTPRLTTIGKQQPVTPAAPLKPTTAALLPPTVTRTDQKSVQTSVSQLVSSFDHKVSLDSGYTSRLSPNTTTVPSRATPSPVSPSVDIFYPSDITPIRHLERGAQGSVQLASTKFYRRIAVKYFERSQHKGREDYVNRELVNMLSSVMHPHIVQIHGILFESVESKEKGEAPMGYLMEYMKDGSLHSVIHSKPVISYCTKDVLNWTRQASSALCYLHEKGILHRDVKPANMLLSQSRGRLKLCDLGLSGTIDLAATADVGTVLYMAPEVMSSVGRTVVTYDEKADVYSLAVSIWEMIHRRRPFSDTEKPLFEMISLVCGAVALRPVIDPLLCSKPMSDIIERSWGADPARRPTMDELHAFSVDELEKIGFFEIYE